MDFMKVFDQTVREIKREVNIKVLKVPEIEQKVLDATNNEPWGPHGSALTEIAQATKKFTECQLIMTTLWARLGDGGRNWRHVYKALAVLEYLVAHGSERALDDIIEHTFQISSLSGFDHVEPNGKDVGINVRKKAETITALLSNKDKIQEVRDKAAANRDKYFGLSSTGITYKSSTASTGFGSSNFQPSERYGGISSKKDGEVFKDNDRDGERTGRSEVSKDGRSKLRRGHDSEGKDMKKGSSHFRSRSQDVSVASTSRSPPKSDHSDGNYGTTPFQSLDAPDGPEDDFDDFDPRGTSKTEAAATNVNQVNLFGDLMDAPVTISPGMTTANENTATEVDLFADAAFVSAPPSVQVGAGFQAQGEVDLFASQPATTSAPPPAVDLFATQPPTTSQPTTISASPPAVDLFATQNPAVQIDTKPSVAAATTTYGADPFASMPLNNFGGSDLFGDFTSHTDQRSAEPIQSATTTEGSLTNASQKPLAEMEPSIKKGPFQVKSGIWADSLSRGLIDLNITAPKKTNLADIGIVGGLGDGSDEKEKGGPPAMHMGRAMGTGSGLGRAPSGFNNSASTESADDFFSSLGQQQQFSNFKK